MDELELVVNRKGLKLVIQDKDWCKVYLINNHTMIILGSNSIKKIVSKLLKALISNENTKNFIYQGIKMSTVLNLMDPHTVIAKKERKGEELELVVLDKEGDILPVVNLSTEDIVEWIEKLTVLAINYTDN